MLTPSGHAERFAQGRWGDPLLRGERMEILSGGKDVEQRVDTSALLPLRPFSRTSIPCFPSLC